MANKVGQYFFSSNRLDFRGVFVCPLLSALRASVREELYITRKFSLFKLYVCFHVTSLLAPLLGWHPPH